MGRLFCVIPCYNEQEVLPTTSSLLRDKLHTLIEQNKISSDSRIVFVNDGSRDATWEIIQTLHEEDEIFQDINLSKNMGHQNALLAGLMTVKDLCDAAISLDADLQDDINAIDEMIDKFNEGRKYLIDQLDANGYAHKGEAGNFIFIKTKTDAEKIVARMKEEKKILIKSYPNVGDFGTCLRVSIGEKKYMEKFVESLIELDRDKSSYGIYTQFTTIILITGLIRQSSFDIFRNKSESPCGDIQIFRKLTVVGQYVKSTQQSSTSLGK